MCGCRGNAKALHRPKKQQLMKWKKKPKNAFAFEATGSMKISGQFTYNVDKG